MTPSHFVERLLANLSADHNKIVRVGGEGKIVHAKFKFLT